ncbi:MAG: M28 family peptidase [Saprospiraceae bacterium]|nr:M28 family peptidase [Saprospiraceae bacterium]
MKDLKLFLGFSLSVLCFPLFGQPAAVISQTEEGNPRQYAETIQASDLNRHLVTLASDEYEGRETGTVGQKKAADYIAAQFEAMGLEKRGADGTYFQPIAYTAENWESIDLQVGKTDFRHLWDFYSYPAFNSDVPLATFNEIMFLGYGIDDPAYSDYDGVNVRDKAVLIYPGEPKSAEGISFLTGTSSESEWSGNWIKKIEAAYQNGAAVVFIIDPQVQKTIAAQRQLLLNPRFRIGKGEEPENKYANSVFISTTVAKEMLGRRYKKVIKARDAILVDGKPRSVKLKTNCTLAQDKRVRQIIGENVLGYIEGTDPALREELIIVSAHYDHLGKKGDDIYNGADDNASGTSTVMEVAEAFQEAKKAGAGPRRSMLFLLVSGEEKGLLGSRYYVENPIFPLENTVADVNVDMVGRVDEAHAGNPNYIYVIGADRLSTELHAINEKMNANYTHLELDYTYNAEDDPNRYYYRSDHYNFAEKGIPAVFFFNGTHADYHMITDTSDKIDYEKMAVIGRLVFHTSWELANRNKRIEVDVK